MCINRLIFVSFCTNQQLTSTRFSTLLHAKCQIYQSRFYKTTQLLHIRFYSKSKESNEKQDQYCILCSKLSYASQAIGMQKQNNIMFEMVLPLVWYYQVPCMQQYINTYPVVFGCSLLVFLVLFAHHSSKGHLRVFPNLHLVLQSRSSSTNCSCPHCLVIEDAYASYPISVHFPEQR